MLPSTLDIAATLAARFGAMIASARGPSLRSVLAAALVALAGLPAVPVQAADFELLKLGGRYVKWGETTLGTGASVSYAFLGQSAEFPGAVNCQRMTAFDGLAPATALRTRYMTAVRNAFAMWQGVANLAFREVRDPAEADILIGVQAEPEGIAFANVEPAQEGGAIAAIRQALICFNPKVAWTPEDDGVPTTYSLQPVVAHEIGHTLGLDHPGRHGALMAYAYVENGLGLQPGDIAGIVKLYGPAIGTR